MMYIVNNKSFLDGSKKLGKLIIIEGSDGSGKQTQTEKLYKRLQTRTKIAIKKVSFPNYESKASEPVKMYLAGEFGENTGDVNAYAASVLYSVDRFASYKKDWEKFYLEGGVVISDRYTTSNMIHQLPKIEKEEEQKKYLDWITDLEWNKVSIPKPDAVFFLDMPYEFSQKLMKNRDNKITGEAQKDIHERDEEYMKKSYETAKKLAIDQKWEIIKCVKNDTLKTIDEINDEILKKVLEIIK